MKTCIIYTYAGIYTWFKGMENDILKIHLGHKVVDPDIRRLLANDTITKTDLEAIRQFDQRAGTEKDLRIIQALGSKLGIQVLLTGGFNK